MFTSYNSKTKISSSSRSLMPTSSKKYNKLEIIVTLILITFIVSILGCIDYLTGEVSVDILYILTLCVITWFTNIYFGILCVFETLISKITADYFDHIKIGSHLYEWNAINYLIVYLVVCILVGNLRKALSK